MRILNARSVLVVMISFSILGCVSLTPQGNRARVTSNPAVVEGCDYLGEVKGDSAWGGYATQSTGEKEAWKELKNEAGAMGADTVLLTKSTTGFSGSVTRGEAYRCNALS